MQKLTFLPNKKQIDNILKFRPPPLLLRGIGSGKKNYSSQEYKVQKTLQAYPHLDVVGGLKLSAFYSVELEMHFSAWHGEQINSGKSPSCTALTLYL